MSPPISETININWAGIQKGKPFYTVSSVSGATFNNGADFGPDSVNATTGKKSSTGGQAECDAFLATLGGGVAYLVSGQVLSITPSGGNIFSVPTQSPPQGLAVPQVNQVTNPGSTTSLSFSMAGCNQTYTPKKTGSVLVIVTGSMRTNTTGDGGLAVLRYGTGTPPINGAGTTGTPFTQGPALQGISTATSIYCPFCLAGTVTGLTTGITYWFDLAFEALIGGTFSLDLMTWVIVELAT